MRYADLSKRRISRIEVEVISAQGEYRSVLLGTEVVGVGYTE
ncbi:hypothetical protein LEP1GSC061_1053 [Leptospira wolffii serovar Khorat str. Khorat-H2]|nr:hypothetical protein LEP1GSC061_1053 [Leptospira wolffii serovar Khorat str. Khorat-H2]